MTERETYLKFLKLAYQTKANRLLSPEDSVCEKLLELIALAEEQQNQLTVTQAMRFSHLASPSTLYRKLGELMQNGYIVQEYKAANRRKRYLRLTEKSQAFFSRMGEFLVHSVAEVG